MQYWDDAAQIVHKYRDNLLPPGIVIGPKRLPVYFHLNRFAAKYRDKPTIARRLAVIVGEWKCRQRAVSTHSLGDLCHATI